MKTEWYKNAVIYQIYPRSFMDSNGDGIGDIRGIISKLDYLKDLGIDAVWLSPCYKSPNDDNGYDISDYTDIMDEFGTLDDWQEMIDGMHQRGIKLIMDLVVNHTSDEHMWFKEALKSKDSPYHDYYYFRKGNGKKPPNKWKSFFTGSAWEYVPALDEYYLHLFSKKQPDLNWNNPKVRKEVENICRFWLDKGVDGFRCDVIPYIAKPEELNNNPPRSAYITGENWEKYISELSINCLDNYDTMIVGEAADVDFDRANEISDERKHLLDTLFHFEHMHSDAYFGFLPRKFSLVRFKKIMSKWQHAPRYVWQSLYYENHDQPRSIPRFMPDGEYHDMSAKALAMTLYFQRGTPYIYEGQELGMTNTAFRREDYRDIASINIFDMINKKAPFLNGYAEKALLIKARDHARTPMQWDASSTAGFTTGTPWMMVNPNNKTINVDSESTDPDSVLSFYKYMLAWRKQHIDIVKNGDYIDLDINNKNVWGYMRHSSCKVLVVLVNFSTHEASIKAPELIDLSQAELVMNNADSAPVISKKVTLAPCQGVVYYGDLKRPKMV